MTAEMSIKYDFGGTDNTPGTEQDIDDLGPPTLRFKRADNATIDDNDILLIPAAGTNYSRWKQIYLFCDVAPDTQIDNNIRLYTDETAFATGVVLKVGDEFPIKNSGADTGYDVSDADEVMTNHADISASTNAFTFTAASPLTGSISEAGNVINLAGETSNYFVLQVELTNTASPQTLGNEVITIQFDES